MCVLTLQCFITFQEVHSRALSSILSVRVILPLVLLPGQNNAFNVVFWFGKTLVLIVLLSICTYCYMFLLEKVRSNTSSWHLLRLMIILSLVDLKPNVKGHPPRQFYGVSHYILLRLLVTFFRFFKAEAIEYH